MVRLVTNCSDMANEASELVRAFFPKEKVDFLNAHCHENVFFILSINWSEDSGTWLCTLLKGERLFHAVESIPLQGDGEDVVLFKRRKKAAMKKAVYSVLKQLTGKSLPYGMLTASPRRWSAGFAAALARWRRCCTPGSPPGSASTSGGASAGGTPGW